LLIGRRFTLFALIEFLFGFLFLDECFTKGDHIEIGHDEEEKNCRGEEVDDS
jgi:hypothetical protein